MYKSVEAFPSEVPNFAPGDKLIMLVDDDPVFRRITSGFLKSQGYKVVEAKDGLDGLRKLREVEPDLIMCDLSMPILDGIEFVEEVSLEYPSLPLIVVSATEDMSDVANALKFGIKDFLPKPISNHQHLMCSIESTLDDSDNHLSDQRDFSSQWFRVDSGDVPEEQELHWHLKFLQENRSAAKDLLHALLPERDTQQGDWRCSYKLLQSAEVMPVVFDYAWLMNGQFAFYLVDSATEDNNNGAATTLLIRALFHDYLRNLKCFNADLKDLAYLIEKGMKCYRGAQPVKALFGVADLSSGMLSILPAGLECLCANGQESKHIQPSVLLGDSCVKNFIEELPIDSACQLKFNCLGTCSFSLDIYRGGSA